MKLIGSAFLAVALALGTSAAPGRAQAPTHAAPAADIGFIKIGPDITLRRMIVRSPKAKGVVLFLHGFPETLYAFEAVSRALGDDYEVHAFDWPGYGLSSRPDAGRFAYAPRDYARVLKAYIDKARIDTSRLTVYATDIGALPALLLALDEPRIARQIIVGDFAPFNRPQYMYASLQSLKSAATADATRTQMNRNRDEILSNAFGRGLPEEARFEVPAVFRDDMRRGWNQGDLTSADAFFHYYAHFTRDQDELESRLGELKTPVKVIWGEKDLYISKDMGAELARRLNTDLNLLPGIGHYPHLQAPDRTIAEVRASLSGQPSARP